MSDFEEQRYAGPSAPPPAAPPIDFFHQRPAPPVDPVEPVVEEPADSMSSVEIGRNGRLAVVVGALAALVALAFLIRHDGSVDVIVGLVLAGVAAYQLWTAWDARTPLLLADDLGVRLRLGREWQGLPWTGLDEVEHQPRRTWWRDGRLVLLPRDEAAQVDALSVGARRHATVASTLYGAPFALPLGLVTTVAGGTAGLSTRLADLAGERTTIVEIDPEAGFEESDTESVDGPDHAAETISDTAERPIAASPTPAPLREPIAAVRAEITHDLTREVSTQGANALRLDTAEGAAGATALPEAAELHRSEDPFTGLVAEPAAEPVIGPELAAARERIGLSVDQLAERTRIRPHVIEAIEVDDFAPCGGDFYARGHLRTLARVLGVDVVPLLVDYDESYADSPVDPRRVFESELATGVGGPIRSLKGGPNWSVLVAAVMAIVLAWSIARLVFDDDGLPTDPTISLSSGSAGTDNPYGKTAPAIPVVVTAAGGGAEVVIRDGAGDVVFNSTLAFGESKTLQVSPPVRIQSSDGSLTVSVNGAGAAAIGETGVAAQKTYTAAP